MSDTVNEIMKGLTNLCKQPDGDKKDGVNCLVSMSDDMEVKVAVIKSQVSGVFEVYTFERIDEICNKRIAKSTIVYGKKKTAQFVEKLINKEVRL